MAANGMLVKSILRQLDGGVSLGEVLLAPEVVVCHDDDETMVRILRELATQVVEELPAGEVYRRRIGADVELREVKVSIERPPEGLWESPLELAFHVVQWRHGEEAYIAYVPALGIEVVAAKEEELARMLPEHIRLALQRTKAVTSLLALAQLQRTVEVSIQEHELVVDIKTPKEREQEEEQAEKKKDKPVIESVGVVLSAQAQEPAYEMDEVAARIADVLVGRRPRSVLLVGPSGVGKTAAVRELSRQREKLGLTRNPIWSTSGSRLIVGMSGFGMWQERCQKLCKQAAEARAVLHLGNLVELMEVGRSEYVGQGIAGFLRPHLQRGDVLAIAEATPEQLPLIERQDPHLLEAFCIIRLEELSAEAARRILESCMHEWGGARGTMLSGEAMETLDRLHRRYASYSAYPGRPLRFLRNLVNDAPAAATVSMAEVTAAFSRETGLPLFMLDDEATLDLGEASRQFSQRVIGQEEASRLVVDLLASVKTALNRPRRPIASLLFIGPTGVGKTEMAKAIAEYFFGDARRISRFDMSEYGSPAAVQRLVGSGFSGEGLLTSKVREQPFSVILFDEFEKADGAFFDLLLQVLGEARLTDAAGRLADFSNAIVIMTSNLGAQSFQHGVFGLARQGSQPDARLHFTDAVRGFLRPEMFNRIDRIVPFLPLGKETIRQIVRRELELIGRRDGFRLRSLEVEYEPAVLDHLAEAGYHPLYGARPLRRAIERELLVPLSDGVNGYAQKARLRASIGLDGKKLTVMVRAKMGDEPAAQSAAWADLASRAAAFRRQLATLSRSSAVLSVQNELEAIRQEELREKKRRKGKPPRFDAERAERQRRLQDVETAIKAFDARCTAAEDQALAVVYEDGAGDAPAASAELHAMSGQWHELLLSLYALRHPKPDQLILAVYSDDPASLHRLATAYYTMLAGAGAAVDVHWYVRHSPTELRREQAAKPDEFLGQMREGTLGIALAARGPNVLPRYDAEAGLHAFKTGDIERMCLVDTSGETIAKYRPPPGVERQGAITGGVRRAYDLDRMLATDAEISRELHWTGRRIEMVIAAATEELLRKALARLLEA